ncbi:MAG: hypothetical protein H6Q12_30 [Bacteroidetes bacterium]|nr:hypothetical protein [Bacteroidota bacterium]
MKIPRKIKKALKSIEINYPDDKVHLEEIDQDNIKLTMNFKLNLLIEGRETKYLKKATRLCLQVGKKEYEDCRKIVSEYNKEAHK